MVVLPIRIRVMTLVLRYLRFTFYIQILTRKIHVDNCYSLCRYTCLPRHCHVLVLGFNAYLSSMILVTDWEMCFDESRTRAIGL
jgi:hypothetical protein